MSTAARIDVFGAPDVATVAAVVAMVLDADAFYEGRVRLGDVWSIASPDWHVSASELREIDLLPTEGDVWLSIHHANGDVNGLHRLTGRLFTGLSERTAWGLSAGSEADGFAARGRAVKSH